MMHGWRSSHAASNDPKGRVQRALPVGEWRVARRASSTARDSDCHGLCPWVSTGIGTISTIAALPSLAKVRVLRNDRMNIKLWN